MSAVMQWDKHDQVEVIATTPELAQKYIASRWSDEGYSIKTVTVIVELPEPRTLYEISGRLRYDPSSQPSRQEDERTEFPGLGDGALAPIDQVVTKLSEYPPYGWDISATGWDRQQVETAFAEHMSQARRLRAARVEAFSRFPLGCVVVRSTDGQKLIRSTASEGAPCWQTASGVVLDAHVDPAELTVIA
ncbi:hypothetical protein ABZ897_53785 [Nonomuraea sp. NPDC046802]|uniref:hypothetical protein n=1 Tax=Nonomuraea sp. NPDC046802 TaxID=3154919 RepID=UPI003401978D